MKSAIEAVLNRELANQNPDMSKEYWEANAVTIKKEKAFLELIKDNTEAVKAFEDYIDAEGESSGLEVVAYYKEGFRRGFRIVLEGMKEE